MSFRSVSWQSVASLALAGFLTCQTLHAQSEAENKAAARQLGIDGIRLAMAGRCEDALDQLERAHTLYFAPTIAYHLGKCQIEVGQLVAGTEVLQQVVRAPLASDAPPPFLAAQKDAKGLLDETLPRLAHLTIRVEAPTGLEVEVHVDGQVLPQAMVGVARPIDPGDHVVVATGPQLNAHEELVSLPDGGNRTVTLAPTPTTPSNQDDVSARDTSRSPSNQALRVAGYTALGVGGLGIIAGSAFGVSATTQRNQLDEECIERVCPVDSTDDIDAMKTTANVSTAGFAVGAVGVATGVALLVVAGRGTRSHRSEQQGSPELDTRRHRIRVTPVVGLGHAGLRGRF